MKENRESSLNTKYTRRKFLGDFMLSLATLSSTASLGQVLSTPKTNRIASAWNELSDDTGFKHGTKHYFDVQYQTTRAQILRLDRQMTTVILSGLGLISSFMYLAMSAHEDKNKIK